MAPPQRLQKAESTSKEPAMAGNTLTSRLVNVKVLASGCMTKLEAIVQIHGAWDVDEDAEITQCVVDVGLQCEYAIADFEEIVTTTEQLLCDPPPYEPNPDGRRHRLLELQVLGSRLCNYCVALGKAIAALREIVNDFPEMRFGEAASRASTVDDEAQDLMKLTSELCQESG